MTLIKWLLILAPIESGVSEDMPGYVGPQFTAFRKLAAKFNRA
ncbi:MAG: hypothetical protein ACJATP_003158 [Candidatus Azotimanducaceae bacterium]|jgi:hypothetical protein